MKLIPTLAIAFILMIQVQIWAQNEFLNLDFGSEGYNCYQSISPSFNGQTSIDDLIEVDNKYYCVFGPWSAGFVSIVRLLKNGKVDSTFSDDGVVHLSLNSGGSTIHSSTESFIKLTADNKLIVVIRNYGDFPFISKINLDGTLDESFGNNGYYDLPQLQGISYKFKTVDIINDKIVITGLTVTPNAYPFNSTVGIIMLYDNGTPITSFGDNGYSTYVHDPDENLRIIDTAYDFATNSVYVVRSHVGAGFYDIVKFSLEDLALDLNYGNQGIIAFNNPSTTPSKIGIDGNNNLFIAGYLRGPPPTGEMWVQKLSNYQFLDTTFGNQGLFQVELDAEQAWMLPQQIIFEEENDFITFAGYSTYHQDINSPIFFKPFLCRIDPTGIIDTSFGDHGLIFNYTFSSQNYPGRVLKDGCNYLIATNSLECSYNDNGYNVGIICYSPVIIDEDNDGFGCLEDCDDDNPNINPNQVEIPYNGIDDDCNPETPDDDIDMDGFPLAEDCDDNNPNINPNQVEIPYNGIDDDCNPETPDDDIDMDGFPLAEDCDDNNPNINPDAEEIFNNSVDEDCDGEDLTECILNESSVNVYPNPATTIFQIEINCPANYTLSIYDIRGRLVMKNISIEPLIVSQLISGVYILKIQQINSNKLIFKKVIVTY